MKPNGFKPERHNEIEAGDDDGVLVEAVIAAVDEEDEDEEAGVAPESELEDASVHADDAAEVELAGHRQDCFC